MTSGENEARLIEALERLLKNDGIANRQFARTAIRKALEKETCQALTRAEKQEFPAEFPSDIPPAVTWAEILFRAFGSIKRPTKSGSADLDNSDSPKTNHD